jgi:hypothetical protein
VYVTWEARSQNHDGFEVSRYIGGVPISPATRLETIAVGPNELSCTFEDVGGSGPYQFAARAIGFFTISFDSPAVEDRVEPTQAWTTVYDLAAPSQTPSYIVVNWAPSSDGEPGVYGNETVTLTVSGLPRHKYAQIGMRLDAGGGGFYDMDTKSVLTADADGTALRAGASRYTQPGATYWYSVASARTPKGCLTHSVTNRPQ